MSFKSIQTPRNAEDVPPEELFLKDADQFSGKMIRDRLGIQLLLKRSRPDVVVLPWETEENRTFARDLSKTLGDKGKQIKWIGVLPDGDITTLSEQIRSEAESGFSADGYLKLPYNREDILTEFSRVFDLSQHNSDTHSDDADKNEELVVTGLSQE